MVLRFLPALLILLFTAGCSTKFFSDPEKPHDIHARLQSLEDRIQEQQIDIKHLQTGFQNLQQDTEKLRNQTALRLMDLEMQLEREDFIPGLPPEDLEPEPEEELPAPPSDPVEEKKDPPPPVHDHRQAYNEALQLYYQGKAREAREAFRNFINNHPDSPLLPNAWYWKAETFYMKEEYPRSILTFRQVLENFPDDPKAPDALLKIGYAYKRLDDDTNARFYLQVLQEDYPESNSAAKGMEMIDSLRD